MKKRQRIEKLERRVVELERKMAAIGKVFESPVTVWTPFVQTGQVITVPAADTFTTSVTEAYGTQNTVACESMLGVTFT